MPGAPSTRWAVLAKRLGVLPGRSGIVGVIRLRFRLRCVYFEWRVPFFRDRAIGRPFGLSRIVLMLQRWRFWALVLGIIAVPVAWAGARILDSRRLEWSLKAAKAAIAARSPGEARRLLAYASAHWPGQGEVEFLLGACEQSLGRPAAAEEAWSRVPHGSPFAPPAALYRARLVLEHDRFADAEGLLLDALKGSGAHATEACETLVNLYKLQGRFSEARTLVLGALEIYPNPTAVIRELEKLGSSRPVESDVVRSTLEKASRNAPDDDRIWLGWANLATRSGKFDEAKRWLETCLQRRPNDGAVWRAWLDWALATQDEVEVERALRHLPEDRLSPPEVLSLRAWFAARAGDTAWERRVQEEMVAIETGNLRALERLADLVLADGQAERAAQLRERRAELNRIKLQYENMVLKLDPRDAPRQPGWRKPSAAVSRPKSSGRSCCESVPGNGEAREAIKRLKKVESRRSAGPTLGVLIAELDAAPRRGTTTRAALERANPGFRRRCCPRRPSVHIRQRRLDRFATCPRPPRAGSGCSTMTATAGSTFT